MAVRKVTVTGTVDTYCPNGRTLDQNAVSVSWNPSTRHIDAEVILGVIESRSHYQLYAEDLAEDLAEAVNEMIGLPVTVVVRQITGHGVEAEADCSTSPGITTPQ